ncbi:voltage-gated chloride channel protein [Lactococcus hodotermopsidis]|uniref:Voltage-gated chloride channel protein n=1 Tax=Pseudolactococcus hodotermopsidis TaxID=2709157 RepID=A0A6A0BA68_9LACT|nr:chloride channel protein [Lactococcus hodotermopsidis]GFH41533.1 voltage-gated chloride channel protein [Lactococcus hodotermopsidis]
MRKYYFELAVLTVIASVVGLVVGVLDTIFGRILLFISDFRVQHVNSLIPFLALAGLAITFAYQKIGKESVRGMGLVFAVGHNEASVIPKRLIPLVVGATWLTHLFGGSAGREGVAVQIGATFANFLGNVLKIKENRHIMIMIGMSAGFAGLFQTPLAASLFAVEALTAGKLYTRALLPSLAAAYTASTTSHLLGLEKFSTKLAQIPELSFENVWKIIIIAIIFGLTGYLFSSLLAYAKAKLTHIFPNPYLKIAIGSVILSILLIILWQGRYSGLGTNLIAASFENGTIFPVDFAFKLILTIITLAIGFQGGEVTPLFAIGATLGIVLASIFGLPLAFVAALGYAAVFASATNTLLAPMFIGVEVFGFNTLPFMLIAVAIAYTFNFDSSIYGAQKKL